MAEVNSRNLIFQKGDHSEMAAFCGEDQPAVISCDTDAKLSDSVRGLSDAGAVSAAGHITVKQGLHDRAPESNGFGQAYRPSVCVIPLLPQALSE